jgi:hypothetical protein
MSTGHIHRQACDIIGMSIQRLIDLLSSSLLCLTSSKNNLFPFSARIQYYSQGCCHIHRSSFGVVEQVLPNIFTLVPIYILDSIFLIRNLGIDGRVIFGLPYGSHPRLNTSRFITLYYICDLKYFSSVFIELLVFDLFDFVDFSFVPTVLEDNLLFQGNVFKLLLQDLVPDILPDCCQFFRLNYIPR